MKITFIRPNIGNVRSGVAMQPLSIALLAGLTPKDTAISFYDDCIEEINYDEKTNLAAMTVETFTAKRAYRIAAEFRKRNVPVVMGGYHPTLVPDEVLNYADIVACGDGDSIWPQIVDDFAHGHPGRIYHSDYSGNHINPVYERRIFRDKNYFPLNIIQWGRGCPHNCDFCSIKAFYGNRQSYRSVEDVAREMSSLDNRVIFFADDNICHNKTAFIELMECIKPLNKKWVCQISLDAASNEKTIHLLKESGCIMVLTGFESLDKQNLAQMNKSPNISSSVYSQSIRKFHENGIMVYGTFVFGYDNDNILAFDQAVDFAISSKLMLANFNPLYPMPGTPLYNRLQEEGRLICPEWWTEDGFYYGKSIFEPKRMSARELEIGCFEAKKKFNSLSSIFRRGLNFRSNSRTPFNMALYAFVNLKNRREIYHKQGVDLG